MGLVDADDSASITRSEVIEQAITRRVITTLFSIFDSICSTIGSIHPKWHVGVFLEPEEETTTTKKRFPPSSYIEKTCNELSAISALVEVNTLNRTISRFNGYAQLH